MIENSHIQNLSRVAETRYLSIRAGCIRFALAWLTAAVCCMTGCHKQEQKKPTKPRSVSVLILEPQTVRVERDYVGRLDAFLSVDLRPQVSGYITAYYFREGQFVHKGDRLFEIDPSRFRSQVDAANAEVGKADAEILSAEAELAKARDAVVRLTPLAPLDAIPRQQYTDAEAELKVRAAELQVMQANRRIAEARLQQAQVQLGYATVRAPFDGIVGFPRLATGGLATPQDIEPLITISQSDPMRARFAVSDSDYLRYIAPQSNAPDQRPSSASHSHAVPNPVTDMQFHLLLADGTAYSSTGRFYAVSRAADPQTDTIELTVLYANSDNRLRPGEYAKVRADVELRRNALLVPVNSVHETQGVRLVWIVDPQNKAVERKIEAQQRLEGSYLVTDGLQAGEKVIVGGEQKLRPGDEVSPNVVTRMQLQGSGSVAMPDSSAFRSRVDE